MKAIVRHDIRTRSGFHAVEQRVDLDEIVIPGVLHVEYMGDGRWHISIGDDEHSLTVSASPRRVTIVEKSSKVR